MSGISFLSINNILFYPNTTLVVFVTSRFVQIIHLLPTNYFKSLIFFNWYQSCEISLISTSFTSIHTTLRCTSWCDKCLYSRFSFNETVYRRNQIMPHIVDDLTIHNLINPLITHFTLTNHNSRNSNSVLHRDEIGYERNQLLLLSFSWLVTAILICFFGVRLMSIFLY